MNHQPLKSTWHLYAKNASASNTKGHAMTYQAKFTGRTVGAIGIFYPITTTVDGDNEDDARLRLYDRFDHIMGLKLTPIESEVADERNARID